MKPEGVFLSSDGSPVWLFMVAGLMVAAGIALIVIAIIRNHKKK